MILTNIMLAKKSERMLMSTQSSHAETIVTIFGDNCGYMRS